MQDGDRVSSMDVTVEQINALAPDDASVKAAQKLLVPSKWQILQFNDEAIWGECKGSGKRPYQVRVDVQGPAFKCSCPSRKFPCKHSLALLFLLNSSKKQFTETPPPAWVTDWLESRRKRSEKKAQRATKPAKPVDPKAKKKRTDRRKENIQAGLKDLELWLLDIFRQGLATLQSRDSDYWNGFAARMVDAQAPGVGLVVRNMGAICNDNGETDWPVRLTRMMGKLYLLKQGFSRFDSLPPELQADLRTAAGWAYSSEEVLERGDVLHDNFFVEGISLTDSEKLREQRIWLRGRKSGRSALLLNFAYGTQPFEVSVQPGASIEAEVVFFPGSVPQRVIEKRRIGTQENGKPVPGFGTIEQAAEAIAAACSKNPWLNRLPVRLDNVVPIHRNNRSGFTDKQNKWLPVHSGFRRFWHLAALSGGNPISVFCEWMEGSVLPLSSCSSDGFVNLFTELTVG